MRLQLESNSIAVRLPLELDWIQKLAHAHSISLEFHIKGPGFRDQHAVISKVSSSLFCLLVGQAC